MKICVNDLISLFRYDAGTGDIFWLANGRGRIKKKAAGTVCKNGYIGICINGKRIYAHQIAWAIHHGKWSELQIDHINLNKLDNRIANLREATNSQNGKNLPIKSNNTSGFTGVCWDKLNNKWRAIIKVDHKQINLGRYVNIDDAIIARKSAEIKYFGEYARSI